MFQKWKKKVLPLVGFEPGTSAWLTDKIHRSSRIATFTARDILGGIKYLDILYSHLIYSLKKHVLFVFFQEKMKK